MKFAFLFVVSFGSALAGDALTIQAQHGREIYRTGKLADAAIGTAAIGIEGVPLSSSSFACANCHGIWGEGKREGGIETPSLNWKSLTSPAVSALTGRRRAPYSAASLRQAITAGHDSSGEFLHAGMPRFSMPPDRLSEVIAYLERIGDPEDTDPGVSATSIRIGAALPLTGPLAEAGKSIRETLELLFAAASQDGGIYGRNIELVVAESTRRLIDSGNVFALVASLEPSSSEFETAGVPMIGPVTISPQQKNLSNPNVFYLLPTLYDQARAVVDFVVARDAPLRPRFAVIYGGTALDLDVVEGLRHQADVQGIEIVAGEPNSFGAVAGILAKHPDYLVVAGDAADLERVARQLNGDQTPTLIGFIATAQSSISILPPKVAAHALFVAPAFPVDSQRAQAFFSIFETGTSPQTFVGLRAAAFGAGSVLINALRSAGSRLSRESLLSAVERLQHFETGVTTPLTFGPNQRIGSVGAVVLALDPERQSLTAVSDWITPKN